MGKFVRGHWDSESWYGASGEYRAYIPDRLAGCPIALDSDVAAEVSEATARMAELDLRAATLTDTEPLARLLMRSEAMSSSKIEGVIAPAKKILEVEALEELGVSHRVDSSEAAVLANITAMRSSIERIGKGDRISLDLLREINKDLLKGGPLEKAGGVVRTIQNWVGGNDYSPVGAAYVPAPPSEVEPLLEDLVAFCNDAQLPTVAKAAIAHAQFESIHPFADGNGRTGRALVQMIFRNAGAATRTVPPVSLALATDKPAYIAVLSEFRSDDDAKVAEATQRLVSFFARKVIASCGMAETFEQRIAVVQEGWRQKVRPRASSAADRLLRVLPGNPVVSIASAARLTGRSLEAARLAIASLVEAGVLSQNARNRKSNLYTADDVLNEFCALERALGTPGGDTSVAKPVRAVPQRSW